MCVTPAAHPGMLWPLWPTLLHRFCRVGHVGPWKEQRRDTGGEGPRADESPGATRTRVLGAVTGAGGIQEAQAALWAGWGTNSMVGSLEPSIPALGG